MIFGISIEKSNSRPAENSFIIKFVNISAYIGEAMRRTKGPPNLHNVIVNSSSSLDIIAPRSCFDYFVSSLAVLAEED